MKVAEIRRSFLDFFVQRGHTEVPSSSLLIKDDPTLLFTNAGMNQFKGVFLGTERRPYDRATSSQKCFRVSGKHNDLENVGRTSRHHTFFEMLGNFSFGDYFKKEAIAYAWEWVTKVLGLPKDKLYATVFTEDDEAFELWEKVDPALKGRVLRFGESENYWSMGDVGPCGPCAEIHIDRGENFGCGKPSCTVNCECDRYLELWNLVFMQFNRDEAGNLSPLPKPSVDTGAGLERFASVLQDAPSDYETDAFLPLLRAVSDIARKAYEPGPFCVSHRVAADHVRALSFAIADGGLPANDGPGYVLRRILRRAARHGKLLGIDGPYLYRLVPTLVEMMQDQYPELTNRQQHIVTVIRSEEERFAETLDAGLSQFERIREKLARRGSTVIPGEDAFRLFDTFGFPLDLTEVMAEEAGLTVDVEGCRQALAEQRERSRKASQFAADLSVPEECREAGPTQVDNTAFELKTHVIWVGEDQSALVLDRTPFYIEAGGQVDDTGTIENDAVRFEVERLERKGDTIFHFGKFTKGNGDDLCGQQVTVRIDLPRRQMIARNHTATHLLHRALRSVLGDHVQQAGSLVEPDRLRFDFSHYQRLTGEELGMIERDVNKHILTNTPVTVKYTTYDEAIKAGVIALFGEKYGDKVRVVRIGDVSAELCGGTHVESTGEIGQFRILSETGIAAGVRRIEAITGERAYERAVEQDTIVSETAQLLGTAPEKILDRISSRLEELKQLQQDNKKLRARLASGGTGGPEAEVINVNGHPVSVVMALMEDYSKDDIAALADRYQQESEPTVAFLGAGDGIVISAASKSAVKLGVHAGKLMQTLAKVLKGGGGGKPNFAQGKANDYSAWDTAKNAGLERIKDMVAS